MLSSARKRIERLGLRTWLRTVLAVTAMLGFVELADEVMEDEPGDSELRTLDSALLNFLKSLRSPLLTQAMTDLTALGSLSVVLVLSTITFALLMNFRDRIGMLHLFCALIGSAIFPRLLKALFDRERPDVVDHLAGFSDSSFPSGHAFAAAAVYLTLAYLAARHRRSLGYEIFFLGLAVTVMLLVGLSRMYLGVHYPSDVLAGLFAGSAWSLLLAAIFTPLYPPPKEARHVG